MSWRYSIKTSLLSLLLASAVGDLQAETAPATSAAPAAPATPAAAAPTSYFCPPVGQLVVNNLFWQAPGGWVSYVESFDKQITKFEKAQWQGINIGKVLCVYKSDNPNSFPIVLEQKNAQLIPEPKEGNWGLNQGGHRDCLATQVQDCPFSYFQTNKPKDLYEEIDFFNKQKSTN